MHIRNGGGNMETEIQVKYNTHLGDSFDDDEDPQVIKELIEEHIQEYCEEHKIDRNDVTVIPEFKPERKSIESAELKGILVHGVNAKYSCEELIEFLEDQLRWIKGNRGQIVFPKRSNQTSLINRDLINRRKKK